MPQPTPYNRSFSFTQHATQHPGEVPPGTAIDAELNGIKKTTDDLRVNIAKIQRDDGRLANGAVFLDTLSVEVVDFILGNGGVLPTPGSGSGGGSSGGGSTVGGSGVLFFHQLYDAPRSYAGHAGKSVVVRADETGLEFRAPEAPSLSFRDLTDTPDSYAGAGGYALRLNATSGYLEFADYRIVPGAEYARLDQGNAWGGKTQSGMVLSGYAETYQNLGELSGNVVLDLDAGNVIRGRVTGPVNWALKTLPSGTSCRSFSLVLENAGAYAHSWFLGTTWRGVAPTIPASGWCVLTFIAFPDFILAFMAE